MRADRRRIDSLRVTSPRDVVPPEERPTNGLESWSPRLKRPARRACARARPMQLMCAACSRSSQARCSRCSFAPFQWWPLAILCPAVLMLPVGRREAARSRVARLLVQLRHVRRGHLLALHRRLHTMGGAPVWIAVGAHARPHQHHGRCITRRWVTSSRDGCRATARCAGS